MNKPVVSILMPVYNSMDFARSGGVELLPKALDSLLSQTFTDFELIILDNQSIDATSGICSMYATRDPRIRYIVDSEKRFPEEAIGYMATSLMQGKYCMAANDDDLYHPEYIQKMLDFLVNHPGVDMVYPNGRYVDILGKCHGKFIYQNTDSYNEISSSLSNYSKYISKRNVIPIIFGFFKSESLLQVLPFEKFDDLKANVDNLFIAKFFLRGFKCHFIDEELFFYRAKKRGLDVKSSVKIDGMPEIHKPLLIWMYYVRHQLYFFRKLDNLLCSLNLLKNQYSFSKCLTFYSFIEHSLNLLDWINTSYVHKSQDKKNFSKIFEFVNKKLKYFNSHKLNIGSFEEDRIDNVRFQPSVVSGLLENTLKGVLDFQELIRLCYNLSSDFGKSEIVYELEKLLEEEVLVLKKEKELIKSEIELKPEILLSPTKQTVVNENIPKLSVITPSLNLGRFLDETICSIKNQSFSDFEHIVVDGGSNDNTLAILKATSNIKWITEMGCGYEDAMRKGLTMANGKYIINCAISDGFIDRDWFKRCVEVLDSNPEISLVWGFPQYMSEDSKLGNISYTQFHFSLPPQKYDWLSYWLKTKFWLPEGNFCVRREVFDKCFPTSDTYSKYRDSWLTFNYNFNSFGYLPFHIPVVANFGRTHQNQRGQEERKNGLERKRVKAYFRSVGLYHLKLLLGKKEHIYRDWMDYSLPFKVSTRTFRSKYKNFILYHLKQKVLLYLPKILVSFIQVIYNRKVV